MSKKNPDCEADVKKLSKEWYAKRGGWRYSPIQNGMGEHGIHDSVGGIPIVVTPQMVGKTVCLSVTIEDKKPGRREEKDRGMSPNQVIFMGKVRAAQGISICCDGAEDLAVLDAYLDRLQNQSERGPR